MSNVFLLLGSNLGNKKDNLLNAITEIQNRIGLISLKSGIYQSKAWGYRSDNVFYNQIISIQTEMEPNKLLTILKAIEAYLGRIKTGDGYQDRLIDIDILFYGQDIIDTTDLIIPHPKLHNRRFTLVPLVELAGDFIHPVLKKDIKKLLKECKDMNPVERMDD